MSSRASRFSLLLLGALLAVHLSWPEAGTASGSTFVVPPYLDTMVLDILGANGPGGARIFPPDRSGRPLAAGSEEMEEVWLGESILTVLLHRPVPGRWTFQTGSPGRIQVLSQRFFPRGVLLEPAGGTPARQDDRVSVTYQLLDGEGAPLRELSGYPLSPDVTLIKPEGGRVRLAMERRPDLGAGVFRARGPVRCDRPGRYWTEVVVAARDLDGRRVTVFHDRGSGFLVEPLPRRHKAPPAVSLPTATGEKDGERGHDRPADRQLDS